MKTQTKTARDLAAAVAKGAALLDEKLPGWAEWFNAALLSDREDGEILVQLFRDDEPRFQSEAAIKTAAWNLATATLFGRCHLPDHEKHGFEIRSIPYTSGPWHVAAARHRLRRRALYELWTAEAEKRRED